MVTYEPNHASVTELAIGPEIRAVLATVLGKGEVFAESISPVRTGAYRSSFQIDFDLRGNGTRKRARGTLANTSDHAAAVEFGPGTQTGSHVLGRTLARLGAGRKAT